MKTISLVFTLILMLAGAAFAGAEDEVTKSAQSFYSGYMKVLTGSQNAKAWILKSDKVTSAFKKSYSAYMKEPGSDPVICAQDFPDAGFKVSAAKVNGTTASVTLTSRDPSFTHTFKAAFIQQDGNWLLAGTDEIKGK